MNITEAVDRACQEPTLIDAMTWIAVWESERAIQQARRFYETGKRTGANGAGWDTCFKRCFKDVQTEWRKRHSARTKPSLERLLENLEATGGGKDPIMAVMFYRQLIQFGHRLVEQCREHMEAIRVSGAVECEHCGQTYYDHPELMSGFHLLCDGRIGKT